MTGLPPRALATAVLSGIAGVAAIIQGLSIEGLLTAILAIDLAQFAATLEHRGRISALQAAVRAEHPNGEVGG